MEVGEGGDEKRQGGRIVHAAVSCHVLAIVDLGSGMSLAQPRSLVCVFMSVCVSKCFTKWQVGGVWGGGGSKVGKFTAKPRNPLLRDFHTVPRLTVRSQPPTASAPACVRACVCRCVYRCNPASTGEQHVH